jgi:peptidoglycan/LPS O-acetylase OafA/YrhL
MEFWWQRERSRENEAHGCRVARTNATATFRVGRKAAALHGVAETCRAGPHWNTPAEEAMNRIPHIEGLRSYLALWVVLDHILGASGYSDASRLQAVWQIVRSGGAAVDIFIIISGFVIFYLLDSTKEPYQRFITRRFFRLWPLFIILFLLSIPATLVSMSNFREVAAAFPGARFNEGVELARMNSIWDNIFYHVALHVPMLHGTVPEAILPYSPDAFLGPAWSISLEWQFYLIAPLIFGLVTSRSKWAVTLCCAGSILVYLAARKFPWVDYRAFLPMHLEYFFVGGLSYFAFNWVRESSHRVSFMAIGAAIAVFVFMLADRNRTLLPLCFWVVFFGLLLDLTDPKAAPCAKVIGWFFDNKTAQYLGRISYSIYLSHSLVIVLCQAAIFAWLPPLAQKQHLCVLAASAGVLTIVASDILFRLVEKPGMRLGKRMANRLANKADQHGAILS